MNVSSKKLQAEWSHFSPILTIKNERDYNLAIDRLDDLLDEIGTNTRHPLYGLLDTLGTVIHAYEEKHYKIPDCSSAEMIRFLMDEHDVKQADLSEIGSQGVVSEILNGKRELNVRQIRALAKRFSVSPAVFV